MTTIINKYVGITHPLEEAITQVKEFTESWKAANCAHGIHAFDEVWSLEHHYLHCDVCEMEVHIEKIVIPDGKDDVVGEDKNQQSKNES